jgi:cobalamin biosynthesis protein CbiG
MYQEVVAWLHRSPVAKTILVTAAGGAFGAVMPLVQSGNTDPAALAAAAQSGAVAALIALGALWVKRPKDATAADKGEVK